jgi:hypothetical protein
MPKLKYPIQQEDRHLRQKIVFSVMEIDPPSFQGVNKITSTGFMDSVKNLGSGILDNMRSEGQRKARDLDLEDADFGLVTDQKKLLDIQKQAQANKDVLKAMSLNSTGDMIDLYLPSQFTVNDVLNYDEASALNISGAAFGQAINSGSSAISAFLQGIARGTESIEALFTGGTAGVAGRIAASRLASSPLGVFAPAGVRQAVGLTAQAVVNPNLATSFKQVVPREFSFNFEFFPKSAEESIQVKKIIRMFRTRAFPEEIRIGSVPVGFKYPDLFKIRLLSGRQGQFRNVGTPIKLSYLRNITTDYNPGAQQTFHADGSPTQINLSLNFVEYKPQTREDIQNEENDAYYEYYGKSETIAFGSSNEYFEN